VEATIDRIMQTYALFGEPFRGTSEEARAKVNGSMSQNYSRPAKKDPHRLTVCGLTYLRELDGSTDPVKAGVYGAVGEVAVWPLQHSAVIPRKRVSSTPWPLDLDR